MTQEKKVEVQQTNSAEEMERLRDRTDELELIISSLTIFALLSLPGWIFTSISGFFTHLSTSMIIALNVGAALIAGVSYVLATCFIVHLVARAYWVGLIGLRAAFPKGINWNKTPGIGPLSRKYYQETLLDAQLAKRFPRLRENPFYAGLVHFLRRITGFAYPKLLVLPVQLTL